MRRKGSWLSKTDHITALAGRFWRAKFRKDESDVLGPARAPEGRSHYGGQLALYLSASVEGCAIATRAYARDGDPARAIYPLDVTGARVVDLRDAVACLALGIDTAHRAANWRDIRAEGMRTPTWDISDRVRALGLDGMLYASRTDPSMTHLTLFRWNIAGAAQVVRAGDPQPWPGMAWQRPQA